MKYSKRLQLYKKETEKSCSASVVNIGQSVHGKRKLNCKSIVEKCKILKQLEQGISSGEIARTNGIIKQTLCTWIKDVKVIYAIFKDNKTSARRQTLRKFSYKSVACISTT